MAFLFASREFANLPWDDVQATLRPHRQPSKNIGLLGRAVRLFWEEGSKAISTYFHAVNGTDLQYAYGDCLNQWIAKKSLRSFSVHYTAHPVIGALFLKQHRNGVLFSASDQSHLYVDILRALFPGLSFTLDDLVLTCGEEATQRMHQLLLKRFDGEGVISSVYHRSEVISCRVNGYAEMKEPFYLQKEMRRFAFHILSRSLFGIDLDYNSAADALGEEIVPWFIANRGEHSSPPDRVKQALQKLATCIEGFLERGLRLAGDEDDYEVQTPFQQPATSFLDDLSTDTDKAQALIVMVLLTGVEPLAALLSAVILRLAQDSALQQQLIERSIMASELIGEALKTMPPVGEISRVAREELQLQLKQGEQTYHYQIKRGDRLVYLPWFAPRVQEERPDSLMPFGLGPHRCPGSHFALIVAEDFIKKFVRGYQLSTRFQGAPEMRSILFMRMAEDAVIELTPRLEE